MAVLPEERVRTYGYLRGRSDTRANERCQKVQEVSHSAQGGPARSADHVKFGCALGASVGAYRMGAAFEGSANLRAQCRARARARQHARSRQHRSRARWRARRRRRASIAAASCAHGRPCSSVSCTASAAETLPPPPIPVLARRHRAARGHVAVLVVVASNCQHHAVHARAQLSSAFTVRLNFSRI